MMSLGLNKIILNKIILFLILFFSSSYAVSQPWGESGMGGDFGFFAQRVNSQGMPSAPQIISEEELIQERGYPVDKVVARATPSATKRPRAVAAAAAAVEEVEEGASVAAPAPGRSRRSGSGGAAAATAEEDTGAGAAAAPAPSRSRRGGGGGGGAAAAAMEEEGIPPYAGRYDLILKEAFTRYGPVALGMDRAIVLTDSPKPRKPPYKTYRGTNLEEFEDFSAEYIDDIVVAITIHGKKLFLNGIDIVRQSFDQVIALIGDPDAIVKHDFAYYSPKYGLVIYKNNTSKKISGISVMSKGLFLKAISTYKSSK